MKVIIFGATGFLGSALATSLAQDHEVVTTTRKIDEVKGLVHYVDLLDITSIRAVLDNTKPEVVISCAGVVDTTQDVTLNKIYTENILNAVVEGEHQLRRIVISGSAAEYGEVDSSVSAVLEDQSLTPASAYGEAKKAEEQIALEYVNKYQLPVVVVRVFNPVGYPMAEKFFIMRLKKQINEYIAGTRENLEVSRRDSLRDYIAVSDVVSAYRAIIEGEPRHLVYNIGSGIATSNEELLKLMIEHSKIEDNPVIVETLPNPEPVYANKADISRMKADFNWTPQETLSETIRNVMYE